MAINRRELLVRAAQLGALGRTKALSLLGSGLESQTRGLDPKDQFLPPHEAELNELSRGISPRFEDYASVEALSQGYPVYGFDYMMYIYGISPDLMPHNVMQEGNRSPRVKIRPKKFMGNSSQPVGFKYRASSANAQQRQPSHFTYPSNRWGSEYRMVQLRLSRAKYPSRMDSDRSSD